MLAIPCSVEEARNLIIEHALSGTIMGYEVKRFIIVQNDPTGIRLAIYLQNETRLLFVTNPDSGELRDWTW